MIMPGKLTFIYHIRIKTRQGIYRKMYTLMEGTPEGEGVYLTIYPELSPNTDSISF